MTVISKYRSIRAASLVGFATIAALIGSLYAVAGGAAFAGGGSTPPWDNTGTPPADPNSQAPYGFVVFYDAQGRVVTGGSNLSHLFDYAAATSGKDTGATRATMYFAAPSHTLPTSSWAFSQQSASNTFPNPSAPAPLTGTGGASPTGFQNPVDTLAATDANLTAAIGGFTLDTTAGYANLIQVRLKDSGAGGAGSGSHYWSTDIAYNPDTVTTDPAITVDGVSVAPSSWAQIYPNYTTTAVALGAAPPSPETASGCPPAGSNVTLTATITPTGPSGTVSGTVQFLDGTTPIGSPVTVAANSAQTTLTAPSVGTHPLSAVFTPTGGTEVQGAVSPTQNYVVNQPSGGLTTTTTLMASPTSAPYSAPVMLTAQAVASDSSSAGATGSVQFFLNGTTPLGTSNTTVSGTPPTGTATLSTSTLPVGTDNLTATFTPSNGCYSRSTSTPATPVTVTGANTTTAVVSSLPSGSVTGQGVTYTATVSPTAPASATPTGSVQFTDGVTNICAPVTLNGSGVGSCTDHPATHGSHSITAVYTPADSKFVTSSSTPITQMVSAAATTTVLMSSANPANIPPPAAVTYTATVTANSPGSGTPAGTVDFKDSGTTITGCSAVMLTSGSATCTQTYGTPGPHPITAVYNNADGNYVTSTSAVLNEQVVTATTTAVTPPSGSIVNGQPGTYTAKVTPTPDAGTVDFFDGSTKICSAAAIDPSGHANCTAPIFGAGNHSITATYSGDSNFGRSTSSAVTQTVNPDGVTVTLSSSAPNGIPAGQKVSYTATITPNSPGTGTPQEGYVQFQDNGSDISGCTQVTVSAGQAVCDPVYAGAGSHSISAIYHDPTGNYTGASSAAGALTQTVTPPLGYRMAAADGSVYVFNVPGGFYGSMAGHHLNGPIVGMALTHSHNGYWLVGSDGGLFTFGDAVYYGGLGAIHLNAPVVGITATPSGNGYWLVAADGGVFTFGDAVFYGSMGATHLNAPVVGIAATPSGHGYWLVAKDGGVFTFGDAVFYGSMGATHLNSPIVGVIATQSGMGYRLIAGDGGVFDFGDAAYQGSLPGSGIAVNDVVGGS